jgi:hypoxanthine phosphoribosyltransferase
VRAEQPSVLFGEEQIRRRVIELAQQISRDYAQAQEIYLVGVLKGAFVFLADLARRLSVPRRVDFVAVASYGDSTTPQELRLIMDLRSAIQGRHVLIVDDILDTGSTLSYVKDLLSARGPASVKTCVLARKQKAGMDLRDADYVGFEIGDVWVVGYGLDYAEAHRALPYIGVLDPPA